MEIECQYRAALGKYQKLVLLVDATEVRLRCHKPLFPQGAEQFPVKIPQLPKQNVTGAVRVKGRVRGYISGMVDAEFDGILRGQLDANVSNGTAVTQLTEEEETQKGEQNQ
jgi:hypothetical protein